MQDAKQITVSVAMATYNGADFIEQQLQSLANQTTLPHELVVCDDQSTDATVSIVEAFSKNAPFNVKLVRNAQNVGWRENFIKAASLCDGNLISFCDQDDIWYPEKIGRVRKEFSSATTLACFHDADLIDRDGLRYSTLLATGGYPSVISPLSRPFTWSNPLGLTLTFRRELLHFNSFWPLSIDHWNPVKQAAHDQWFFFLAITLGQAIFIPETLLGYRQHGGNTVGWAPSTGWSHFLKKLRKAGGKLTDHLAVERRFIEIFEEAADMPELIQHRSALQKAIVQHKVFADRLDARSKLYSVGLGKRLQTAYLLLSDGAYSGTDPWKFGRKDMLVDSMLAAPFSPMFQYIKPERTITSKQ